MAALELRRRHARQSRRRIATASSPSVAPQRSTARYETYASSRLTAFFRLARLPEGHVALDGEVWDGTGIDLSRAEFLIILSCSLGTLRQGRINDVDGFCANLTANGARSIMAFRHPVRGVEAALLTEHVIESYLRIRQTGQNTSGLRPFVVNEVRKHFLRDERIKLDTLIAIDCFGMS